MTTLNEFIHLIPNEAVIIVSRSGDIVDMSPGARSFCDLFGEDVISTYARKCSGESTVEVSYQTYSPESHKVALGRKNVMLRVSSHSPPTLCGTRLVVIDRILNYESLLDNFETVLFMCENIPMGISLHILDPITGRNWNRFPSKLYAELNGCSVETLEERGTMAVGNLVPPDDNRRASEAVLNAAVRFGDCIVTPRIFRDGAYKYTRFYGRSRPGENGLIESSVLVEDFTEQAHDMNRVNIYKCANYMLSSFARAVFDVCFYTDSKFKIIDDNPKLRYFFATDHTTTLINTPLEAFMKLDEDKQRFRDYVAQRLELQAQSDPEKLPLQPAATMIPLRLALAGEALCNVQLYATPTYLHGMEGFGSTRDSGGGAAQHLPRIVLNADSLQRGCMYLVGIRVVESQQRDICTTVPDRSTDVYKMNRRKSQSSNQKTSTLPHVPEDDYCTESASSSTSAAHRFDPSSLVTFSRKQVYATTFVRCLIRDMHGSLSKLVRLSKSQLKNTAFCEPIHWVMPLVYPSDRSVILDEILMSLPQNLQKAFVDSSTSLDYMQCSQLLGHSVDGNFDLLRQSLSLAKLTGNIDATHNSFRFFLGLVEDLDGKGGLKMLSLLEKSFAKIQESIPSRIFGSILRYEYTLVLLSHATQYSEFYSSDSSLYWLRSHFRAALRESESNLFDKSRISPVVYLMCFLWGVIMMFIGRTEEAIAVWENSLHDIHNYVKRHPWVSSVQEIQALICYNLGLSFIMRGVIEPGLSFIHQLREISVQGSDFDAPLEYQHLIKWAEQYQSIVQHNSVFSKKPASGYG